MIPGDLSRFREIWRGGRTILDDVLKERETFWVNPNYPGAAFASSDLPILEKDVIEASDRLLRFAPFIRKVFPETHNAGGIIESELRQVPSLKKALDLKFGQEPGRTAETLPGRLYMKLDNSLPVSGSIKARGGIYQVLKTAEELALTRGMISGDEEYGIFASEGFKEFFSGYTISVGSTGNLGLSIGIMGSALGFRVTVHMSSNAKDWKKELLRSKGVEIVEYESDYSAAVAEGRRRAESEPENFFVDDENSKDLFLGYAVGALRLATQLKEQGIQVDGDHPLFVYLPCGVGGGPGGITFGLKMIYGANVHCFFAEPTAAPCMLLGLATGLHDRVSVTDFGLSGKTRADGLAVGRASGFVGRTVGPGISGVFTVEDSLLFRLLAAVRDVEGIILEPSAAAGIPGPWRLASSPDGLKYIENHNLESQMSGAVHIIWATGGGMVPENIMREYYERGHGYPES